jgi:hypothetical protein
MAPTGLIEKDGCSSIISPEDVPHGWKGIDAGSAGRSTSAVDFCTRVFLAKEKAGPKD